MATESAHDRDERALLRLGEQIGVATIDSKDVALVICKSDRRLELRYRNEVVKGYTVIVGRSPVGHKEREGDERTPEGAYFICYRNGESRFHLFMGLSYPNDQDAMAALREGVIDADKCNEIVASARQKERPDWYTPLGGEVGIHGGGIGRSGTAGCIALNNPDVEELWAATEIGTPVTILP